MISEDIANLLALTAVRERVFGGPGCFIAVAGMPFFKPGKHHRVSDKWA
jgi:hypothetical protein